MYALRQPRNTQPSQPSRLKSFRFFDKAGTDNQARLAALHDLKQIRNVLRIMLPVAIHLNINVIAMISGIQVTALHGTTNSQVLWQVNDIYAICSTHAQSVIPRPIVYDHVIVTAALNISYRSENRLGLIVGGYNNQNF